MPYGLYHLIVHTNHNVMPHTEIAHTIKYTHTNKRLMPPSQSTIPRQSQNEHNSFTRMHQIWRHGFNLKNLPQKKKLTMLSTCIQRIVYVACGITYTNGFI